MKFTRKSMKHRHYNLQFFAEGGGADGGGTGAEGTSGVSEGASLPSTSARNRNPLANVVYGTQDSGQTAPADNKTPDVVDRNAEFEKLIKGEYKDLYDARVQDTVQKRLKGSKEITDRYNALTPTLELLGKKYGVDPTDAVALNKAIEDDDSYYEDEALREGLSVEQLKNIRKMERENAQLKEQMQMAKQKEDSDRFMAGLIEQEKAVKAIYPAFNLRNEFANPQFCKLLDSGIDVRTAFEVCHKDEIIPAAMQYAVSTAEKKIANKIIAGGNRPMENGIASASSVVTKSDVSQLSKADRAEINRRVARGERITF